PGHPRGMEDRLNTIAAANSPLRRRDLPKQYEKKDARKEFLVAFDELLHKTGIAVVLPDVPRDDPLFEGIQNGENIGQNMGEACAHNGLSFDDAVAFAQEFAANHAILTQERERYFCSRIISGLANTLRDRTDLRRASQL